jgi:hypothetical protein
MKYGDVRSVCHRVHRAVESEVRPEKRDLRYLGRLVATSNSGEQCSAEFEVAARAARRALAAAGAGSFWVSDRSCWAGSFLPGESRG